MGLRRGDRGADRLTLGLAWAALGYVVWGGLGGTLDGVIGALAAVGLAAQGSDGRYISVGKVRDLSGPMPIPSVLSSGVQAIQTLEGETVTTGAVLADKLRPARRDGRAVLFVEKSNDHWKPLKLK